MTERQLDDAIDRAVGEMMAVDAGADFTANVLSRVRPTERRFSWIPVGAAALAAAALLAIVLLPDSPNPSRVAPPPSAAALTPERPAPAPPLVDAAPKRTPTAARVKPPQPATVFAATVDDANLPHTDLAPLDPLDPIVVAPLGQKAISPVPLAITPLTPMAELRVEPLTIVHDPIKGEL